MVTILDRWIGLARCLARMAIRLGGALIFISAFVVSVDVLLRKVFLVSMGGSDELSGYALAIGTSWGLSFVLLERANVRVDALYAHFGVRIRVFCDVLALVSLAIFVGYLGWQALLVLETSLQYRSHAITPLATPLWIPQGLWVAGFALFLFTLIPLLLRTLIAVFSGDLDAASRLAGARTIQEEAVGEVAHATHTELQSNPGYR